MKKQKLHKQKLKMIWFDIKLKISIVQTTNKAWGIVAYVIAESEKQKLKMIWFDIKLKISIVQTTNKAWGIVAYVIAESKKQILKNT